MSQKKIIFIIIVVVLCLGLGIGLMALSGKNTKNTGPKWPKELTVWVVGDDSAGFDPLITAFKKNPVYKDTTVSVSKFASYEDYERTLINVIADGNSPDVFVVPSTGAGLLESKTEPIPDSLFDQNDLSRNLSKLFDPLIMINPGKSADGKNIQVTTLKWVPLGYETMGVYYNRSLLDSAVPASWEEFNTLLRDSTAQPPVGLGLAGRYVTQAASIMSLFLVQSGITSLDKASDWAGTKALENYLSYAIDQSNSIASNIPEMNQKVISTTDLFARGKVSVIFWFPSIVRELEYSIKRAGSDLNLERKDVRSAPVPQPTTGKKYNLARYNYFAVSKYAPNINAAADFVAFLATKEASSLYGAAFPQYLPARSDVLEERRAERNLAKGFQWIVYDSFIPPNDVELINFDRGLTSEFEGAFSSSLTPWVDPGTIIGNAKKRIACRSKQLLERTGFAIDCTNNE